MRTHSCISGLVKSCIAGAALAVLVAPAPAQTPAAKPTIERTPAPYTRPADGPTMYRDYCAACHGISGHGDGPAAPALKVAPTNLTQLSAANKGRFPTEHFQEVLLHGTTVAHGSPEMPTWGAVFSAMDTSGAVQLRIVSLRRFVEQFQGR